MYLGIFLRFRQYVYSVTWTKPTCVDSRQHQSNPAIGMNLNKIFFFPGAFGGYPSDHAVFQLIIIAVQMGLVSFGTESFATYAAGGIRLVRSNQMIGIDIPKDTDSPNIQNRLQTPVRGSCRRNLYLNDMETFAAFNLPRNRAALDFPQNA